MTMKAFPILALMLLLITYRQSKQKILTIIHPSVKSNTTDIAIADQDIINVCTYPRLMFISLGVICSNVFGVCQNFRRAHKQSSQSYPKKKLFITSSIIKINNYVQKHHSQSGN
jgi:hypothetical protein